MLAFTSGYLPEEYRKLYHKERGEMGQEAGTERYSIG
jgi:hypothetical protein